MRALLDVLAYDAAAAYNHTDLEHWTWERPITGTRLPLSSVRRLLDRWSVRHYGV